jgi:hypothetical protein
MLVYILVAFIINKLFIPSSFTSVFLHPNLTLFSTSQLFLLNRTICFVDSTCPRPVHFIDFDPIFMDHHTTLINLDFVIHIMLHAEDWHH